MILSLSRYFYQHSTGMRVLLSFLLMMLFNVLVFPAMQGRMGTFVNPLDMRFGFSAEEALAFLNLLGAEGRSVYLFVESVVDIIYPFVYTLFSVLALSFFFGHRIAENSRWRTMNILLPLFTMLADFVENSGIIVMLVGFPDAVATHSGWTAIGNELKWVGAVLSLGGVFVGFVWWLVQWFGARRTQA